MIALPKRASQQQASNPGGTSTHAFLVVGSQIVMRQYTIRGNRGQPLSHGQSLIAKRVADERLTREQRELAMLQRALVRCGLIGGTQINEE